MYVVLKTRYVNPISTYVDIRSTYIVQTYLPLVHNFYPYAEQQPLRRGKSNQYWSALALCTVLYCEHLEREHFPSRAYDARA